PGLSVHAISTTHSPKNRTMTLYFDLTAKVNVFTDSERGDGRRALLEGLAIISPTGDMRVLDNFYAPDPELSSLRERYDEMKRTTPELLRNRTFDQVRAKEVEKGQSFLDQPRANAAQQLLRRASQIFTRRSGDNKR